MFLIEKNIPSLTDIFFIQHPYGKITPLRFLLGFLTMTTRLHIMKMMPEIIQRNVLLIGTWKLY